MIPCRFQNSDAKHNLHYEWVGNTNSAQQSPCKVDKSVLIHGGSIKYCNSRLDQRFILKLVIIGCGLSKQIVRELRDMTESIAVPTRDDPEAVSLCGVTR